MTKQIFNLRFLRELDENNAKAKHRGWLSPRTKRWIRRTHSYLGLFLMPWLIFFGVSGILFNHPNIGERVEGRRISAEELQQSAGLDAWDPTQAAQAVVAQLAERAVGEAHVLGRVELDQSFTPRFEGYTVLQAPAEDGRHILILDVEGGRGILAKRYARASADSATLREIGIELPQYRVSSIERAVQGLLDANDQPALGPLKAHPKIAPQLRFRVLDESGRPWNLVYCAGEGTISGRRSDEGPALGISQMFAMLHTTHHFPLSVGWTWFWALFEDLLGLAMVVWGVSGVVMWWQIKPTRRTGTLALLIALLVALGIGIGTFRHITFGDVEAAMGPGE